MNWFKTNEFENKIKNYGGIIILYLVIFLGIILITNKLKYEDKEFNNNLITIIKNY